MELSDKLDNDIGLTEKYKAYATEELKKPIEERWDPPATSKMASEFYGTCKNKIAIVAGSGPSLQRVKDQLRFLSDDFVVISVNGAIQDVRSDFWLFIDYDAYTRWGSCENAASAKRLGVDRFWPTYDPETYIWRRSYNEKQVTEGGRLFHQNTSLLAAIHFAFKLGCRLVITVGADLHIKPGKVFDKELVDRHGGYDNYIQIMNFTFVRIILSLQKTLEKWKDPEATLVDASWGLMPCPKVDLATVIKKVKERSDGGLIGIAN